MFCSCYLTCVKQVHTWLNTLPSSEKEIYQRFLFPPIHPGNVRGLTKHQQVIQQSRQTRKEETGAVVIQFSDLRAEAHYRYNRIVRLRQAYLELSKSFIAVRHKERQTSFPLHSVTKKAAIQSMGFLPRNVFLFASGTGAVLYLLIERTTKPGPTTITKIAITKRTPHGPRSERRSSSSNL